MYGDLNSKKPKEAAALERLSSLLPNDVAGEFKNIWNEFEEGESIEAKYVSALDRFLPFYSNVLNQGYSWKNHSIHSRQVIEKNKPPIEAGLAPLWEVAKRMIDEAVNQGHLERS